MPAASMTEAEARQFLLTLLRSTGLGSYRAGEMLYASGPNTLGRVAPAAATMVLHGGGGAQPSFGAVSMTDDITDVLEEEHGGTGRATYVLGDILYASAADTLATLAGQITTTRKFLIQVGTGVASAAPLWDTITSGDVSGLTEAAQDAAASLIQNGTGISFVYDDALNTLTPTVTLAPFSTSNLGEGSNLYFTDERAQDAVGAALTDTAEIDFTYNDASNAISATLIDASIGYVRIQNVSATSRVLGRITAGAGVIEELTAANIASIIQATAFSWSNTHAFSFVPIYLGITSAQVSGITNLLESSTSFYGGTRAALVRAASNPRYQLYRVNGTLAAPTAITSGNVLGSIEWGGHDGNKMVKNIVQLDAVANENWTESAGTTTAAGCDLDVRTTAAGAITNAVRAKFSSANTRWQTDNYEIQVGAGSGTNGDLRLLHDGTNSLIRNDTGELRFNMNGTTVGTRITQDGRFYGTSLHNNAGAVTGTTNQYVASGTYTPTLTNVTNVAASTAYKCQWIRTGNVVTVTGKADVDPTAAGSAKLGISLPIASNLANAQDCAGTAFCPAIANQGAAILADATNDRAQMEWIAVDLTNQPMYFTFSYEVL